MVYLDLTYYPALSWLVSSVGTALQRYRRVPRFKSRTDLNFFQLLLQLNIVVDPYRPEFFSGLTFSY